MILETVKDLFVRDLGKVKKEISLYKNESDLWKVGGEISNCGGNLCLHLIGNLKAFIGAGIAKDGYVRDREFEFNGKEVSKEDLLIGLDEAIESVTKGFSAMTEEDMEKDFPIVIWSEPKNMMFTILHLHSHLNYHLGQLNYHRRMFS